ncbi:MAG: nitronate monooxygenase [Thermoleophilia bacterium]|nr:nitronate monooxygenase [Thermoleophilia bacterium]MDQ3858118.1 nitronate monooxygenase [Actinomycetota bacterium]
MPPDLSVRLGPLALKNPVICASGEWTATAEGLQTAVDSGAAAIVAKSANEAEAAKRQLKTAEYLLLDDTWRPVLSASRSTSLFNRSGLVAEPFDAWVETVAEADRRARDEDAYVVASLIPADLDELPNLARALEGAGVRWLEVNVGAAHGEEVTPGTIDLARDAERVGAIVARVRESVSLPLTVKLPGQGDVLGMAVAARDAGADFLCLVGRPLAFVPDLATRRPVLGTFGVIGGAWALPLTLRWVAKARARLGPDVPLLATNGIRDGRDVARALLAGASAAQLGTAIWSEGFDAIARALADLSRYLEEQGVSAGELVGEAADAVMSYEEVARTA